MLDRHGPIDHLLGTGHDGADGRRRLSLGVVRDWHLLLCAAYGTDSTHYAQALAQALGVPPTASARVAQHANGDTLMCVAPGQHWLVSGDPARAGVLATALAGTGSVTDLSHSRVRVRIGGDAVPALLAKGISIDLLPDEFGAGEFAQVGLHHTGVLLHRVAEQVYELYLPRTFAVTLWQWLTDAALPLGYDIAGPYGRAP